MAFYDLSGYVNIAQQISVMFEVAQNSESASDCGRTGTWVVDPAWSSALSPRTPMVSDVRARGLVLIRLIKIRFTWAKGLLEL